MQRRRLSTAALALLLAACGPAPTSRVGEWTPQQAELALSSLTDWHSPDRDRTLRTLTDSRLGTLRFVVGDLRMGGLDPHASAEALLAELAPVLGPVGRSSLEQTRAVDVRGSTRLRYQQRVGGLRVHGGELSVVVDATGAITTVGGKVLGAAPDHPVLVDGDQALALATDGSTLAEDPGLEQIVWDEAIYDHLAESRPRVAWRVLTEQHELVIDAETGARLAAISLDEPIVQIVRDHLVEDDQTGPLLYRSSPYYFSPSCGTDCVQAAYLSQTVADIWWDEHGRDSYDDAGGSMTCLVNGGYSNAFSRYTYTEYGQGYVTFDVVSHEWNHTMDRYTSNLTYLNQSGALDEALADLRGAYNQGDWEIGEGVSYPGVTPPLRSLEDPSSVRDKPEHMDDYLVTNADDGGVHTNSTIVSHAVYLMVEGRNLGGVRVAAQGWDRIEPLLWDLQAGMRLTSSSGFADFAVQLEAACLDEYGAGDDTCYAVRDGLAAVGLDTFADQGRGADAGLGSVLAGADLDGDGIDDLIAGVPSADVGTEDRAGAVLTWLSDGDTLEGNSIVRSIDAFGLAPQASEAFGGSLATGDIDGDGDVDLVVGVSDYTTGGITDAGAACYLINDGSGFAEAAGCVTQAGGTSAESGDHAGLAVALGDFDCDGYADLAMGAPAEDWSATVDTGAVTLHYSNGARPSASSADGTVASLTQSVGAYTAEPGDLFGASLAVADFDDDGCDDLVVGAPYEDWGATDAVGMVTVIFGDPSGLGSGPVADITPGTFGLSGTDGAHLGHALATGDFDGDGDADLAISSPGADAGSVASSGAVWILENQGGALIYDAVIDDLTETSPEAFDALGSSLAAGDLNYDGIDDLVIGSPSEDNGSVTNAGSVAVRYGDPSGLGAGDEEVLWSSDVGLGDAAENQLGAGLAVGRFHFTGIMAASRLAVGVPGVGPLDTGTVCLVDASGAAASVCLSEL